MKDFKGFKVFLESVETKNTKVVIQEIANMVILLRGDRSKIYDAVNYAIKKEALFYKPHEESPIYDWVENEKDKFAFEQGFLEENFSKRRLNDVLDLYDNVYKDDNNIGTIDQHRRNRKFDKYYK